MTRTISSSCVAAMLCIGVAAYAQTSGQSPTQPASQAGSQRMEQSKPAGDRSQTQQQMTLVGCIQRESEYRQAHEGGRGGAMGTGIGVGNEFVLINATTATAGSQTGQPSGTMTGSTAAGTTGTATGSTGTGTTGAATGTPTETGSATATGSTTGSATGTTTGGTQTGAGMSMSSGGTAYALTGDREKELEQHVGQRVEIVGTIEGGASATGSGSATAETTSGGQGFSSLKQLNIVSFRPVGGSCK